MQLWRYVYYHFNMTMSSAPRHVLHIVCIKTQHPDENTQLREQIEEMAVSAALLEQKHKEQMSEALENLETMQRAHKQEVTEVQANIKQQSKW